MMDSSNVIEIDPSVGKKTHLSRNGTNGGLTLACSNIHYAVHVGKGRKQTKKPILRGISAVFRPGRVTAVMGSSGAGKTTLLSLLSGDAGSMGASAARAVLDGDIMLNGAKVDLKKMGKVSGFVYQDDVILPTMTVEEAVMMSARLRLPEDTTPEEMRARSREMMDILSITKCAGTAVGSSASKGISGGERKRVSLAMEMIPNPPILFLDEPTSGLDTVNAYNVVALLSDLARQSERTIILTIHQPPSEIFHMLDDLLLLAEGRVMYHGPAADAVPYFAALGHPCPMYTNPADFFFLELLGDIKKMERKDNLSRERLVDTLGTAWENSQESAAIATSAKIDSAALVSISQHRKEAASFARQFSFLMRRAALNVVRDKMILQVKIMQTVFIGLIIGLIYLDVGASTKKLDAQVQDRAGALYFIVLNQFMGSSMGILSIFSKEKLVFLREHRLGYYKLAAYFLSKTVVELPYQIFFPTALVSIVYYMIGFRPDIDRFAICCLIAVLTALNGMAMGTLSASIFKSMDIALVILPLILLPMMIFSGLVVNNNSIPWYFVWIRYISPTQYAFTAVMKNEFEGLEMHYENAVYTGAEALEKNAMNGGLNIWENIIVLAGTYFILMTASYLALFLLSKRRS